MEKIYNLILNLISPNNIKSINYQDDEKIMIEITGKGFKELAEEYHDLPIPLKLEKNNR